MTKASTINAVKSDPAGSVKALVFLLIAVLLIFVFIKLFKGFGTFTNLLGDAAPATEEQKQQIETSKTFQSGIKWLTPNTGILAIVKAGYHTPSNYMLKKGFTQSELTAAATKIWDAKVPFYANATEIYNAVSALPSKAAISLMANDFNTIYKNQIGFYPLDAFLGKYLSVKEMDSLTKIIDNKPDL